MKGDPFGRRASPTILHPNLFWTHYRTLLGLWKGPSLDQDSGLGKSEEGPRSTGPAPARSPLQWAAWRPYPDQSARTPGQAPLLAPLPSHLTNFGSEFRPNRAAGFWLEHPSTRAAPSRRRPPGWTRGAPARAPEDTSAARPTNLTR